MQLIAHKINSINKLKVLPADIGVEIDIRHNSLNNRLYLNHDPGTGDDLEEYLSFSQNRFVIFNVKEAGIEQKILDLVRIFKIENYFLLDVEFPYLYRATRKEGIKKIAVRYSEAEPIEFALAQKGLLEWVWIDTNTKLPLDTKTTKLLSENFKTCLVSPDRWGRPQDIVPYRQQMETLCFKLDAVMVGMEYIHLWK